jgi:hypothetical protein
VTTRPDRISERETAAWLGVALAVRIVWMALAGATGFVDAGEATHVARTLAATGTFADAFFAGQGPTAHLLPTTAAIAAAAYRLPGSVADPLLALWALAQTGAAWLLARAVVRRLGAASRGSERLALGALALLPTFWPQEACDFRVWEGALAAALGYANLLWLLRLEARGGTRGALAGAAALVGAAFFVSPPVGLAADLAWGAWALRRLAWRQVVGFALLGAVATALPVAPWAMRNRAALGETVWLRSNFGLELAVAFHPAAAGAGDPAMVLRQRMAAIHPFESAAGRAALARAGGEVGYARALGMEARRWMAAHPGAAARLALRHYRQFYVPDTWQGRLTNWADWAPLRAHLMQAAAALGLLALLAGLARRRPGFGPVALYVAALGLPYALVQPIPRYAYPLFPLFVFLAAGLANRRRSAEVDTTSPLPCPLPPPRPKPAGGGGAGA